MHRRLGHTDRARTHLDIARDLGQCLPEDGYGEMVRTGVLNVTRALDAGSTDRLDSHP